MNPISTLLLSAILTLAVLPTGTLAAPAVDDHARSLEEVVQSIITSQGVASQKDIDCNAVSSEQFEELGDALMDVMAGDQHEQMDVMMGGEGSASLRTMHISMGQRYLGCASDNNGNMMGDMGGMMGMMNMMGGKGGMGGGMMNPMQDNTSNQWGGDSSMMGGMWGPMGYGGYGMGGVGMLLFWIVVIAAIVLLVKWVAGQSGSAKKETSALDILKERYAKGEIDKKEFEEKKKDLK